MSKYSNTNKLFYDKYVYKVALNCKLSSYFRGNKLDKTRLTLESFREEMEFKSTKNMLIGSGYQRTTVQMDEVVRALVLVTLLESIGDYHIRVESGISIFSNDESMIDTLEELYGKWSCREVCRPKDDKVKEFLLANPKAIIRNEYTHKYKVTVNPLGSAADDFKTWAKNLPKINHVSQNYRYGGYFYIADLKTLSMCRLFLGDKIRRIDELRNISEI